MDKRAINKQRILIFIMKIRNLYRNESVQIEHTRGYEL